MSELPVEFLATDRGSSPDPGIALCLSGGGYRAMLFHLGSLWRLHELGVLRDIKRVSSVSGGSIAAGVLGLKWNRLYGQEPGSFEDLVVAPVRRLARRTLDANSVLSGILSPFSTIADKIAGHYDEHLFDGATLQDLPDDSEGPRFVINATNVQSGALWRFSKPYMRDWRVGEVKSPTISLARAVAASSAFPPVLSPMIMELKEADFTPNSGAELQEEPFTTRVVLTDGGVYDNLGLETAYKRFETILVSDGGGRMQPEGEPKEDWARHAYRTLELIDNQVRSLRKRQLISAYKAGSRSGSYWGMRTEIEGFGLDDSLDCPAEDTLKLADLPTRLKRLPAGVQERLINWGYAVTDASVRKFASPDLPAPQGFPYPESGV